MGLFSVPLEVGNLYSGLTRTVEALVDTGAAYSMVPASILDELGIERGRSARFQTASGETIEYRTGIATFAAEGYDGIARVIFGPEDIYLMGATTLEDLMLVVGPCGKRLVTVDRLLL
jgi:predicted aspartyl protease